MNHLGTKYIETERLILRQFKLEDSEAMFRNWANSSNVTKFLTWKPHENIEVTKDILNSWISQYKNKNYYQWAIIFKETGDEPIGSISIVDQNEKLGIVNVGYCIGEKWWHKGITSEALNALIDYFITEVKANRIEARHDSNNPNSGKVMIKCNMKYEGTIRQAEINNQGIYDYSLYSILSDEYKQLFK